MRSTCLFHAGCPDGFGAAWSVWRAWRGRGRYVARGHDDSLEPADFDDQRVVFVDIAPDNDELRALMQHAAQVVVLDHHVSALDRYAADPSLENLADAGGHVVHFDLERSGAVLAWRHFHPDEPVPALLRYVEDEDLWSRKLPASEEVNAALGSYARDFEMWNVLVARPIEEFAAEGEPIVRAQRAQVERSLRAAHAVRIGQGRIEAVNAEHHRNAIGHELAKRAAFGPAWGLVYRLRGTRVDASIYSIGDLDVASVAAGYGGGGHRNAAGFRVSLEDWCARFA